MTFEEAYNKLTPEQKKAVDSIEGPTLVLAGPGTGKTQILTLRIARILQETQLEPHNILCLTFTESGVVAMRKRLFEFIGTPAYYVRIHTFHSFCNEIIQSHPEKFLFARELEALSDVERVLLFQKLIDERSGAFPLKPFASPYLYQKDLSRVIQSLKREDLTHEKLTQVLDRIERDIQEHGEEVDAFVAIHGGQLKSEEVLHIQKQLIGTFWEALFNDFDLEDKKSRTQLKKAIGERTEEAREQLPKQRALVEIYKRYNEELIEKGRYDYEDMILMVLQKLKTDAALLSSLQEKFQYILVDEYQDTNGAQNELVAKLADFYENPNVFAVGDDKQSIYRFQGASLENMLSFYERYKKNIELVSLQHNYRSQQSILDSATCLIKHNEQTLEKLIPGLEQHLSSQVTYPLIKPSRVELMTPTEERHWLLESIKRLIKEGSKASEIAILYRENRDAVDLVELFLRAELPFRVRLGKNILEDRNIQKLIYLLRFLNDPSDERALFFILQIDFLKLPHLETLQLIRSASKQRTGLWDLLPQGGERFKWLQEQLAQWKMSSVNGTLLEFFEKLIQESGYLNHLMNLPDKVEQLNRLNTFFDQIKTWNRAKHDFSLSELLENLKLLIENELPIVERELVTQKEAVNLMTAHKSKGLEFEHVFIMGAVDKHWGNKGLRSKLKLPPGLLKTEDLLKKEKNEDERRLFYVAMTRAKKTLSISYPLKNEDGKDQVPSLFLEELESDTVRVTSTEEAEENKWLAEFAPIIRPVSADEEAYVRSLLTDYQLSVTHLNHYERCPRIFYYEDLLRVPRTKTRHQAFGTASHEALKDFLFDFKHSGVAKKDLLLAAYRKHLNHELLTVQDFKSTEEHGVQVLSNYFENYKDQFHREVLLEENFKSHKVLVEGVPLTGKLDKIELLGNQQAHVVDYKTGNPDSKSSELGANGDYRRQIIFYQLLCDHSSQFPYKMVSGEIDFLEKSTKQNHFIKKHFVVTEEEKKNLILSLKSSYEQIMNLEFLRPDEWACCGECEYCQSLADPR